VVGVWPLPLANRKPRRGAVGTILGYGDDGRGNLELKEMGKVRLKRCPNSAPLSGVLPGALANSVCWWRTRLWQQDTCHGDSGGPLLIRGSVAGVTSGGDPGCTGALSYDTSVAPFLPWITSLLTVTIPLSTSTTTPTTTTTTTTLNPAEPYAGEWTFVGHIDSVYNCFNIDPFVTTLSVQVIPGKRGSVRGFLGVPVQGSVINGGLSLYEDPTYNSGYVLSAWLDGPIADGTSRTTGSITMEECGGTGHAHWEGEWTRGGVQMRMLDHYAGRGG
jgi:hypothetical protein